MPSESSPQSFDLLAYRFCFRALAAVRFPPGKAANVIRGALGTTIRRVACVPECPGAKVCDRREHCAYARLFEPAAMGAGPSGLADWPRPFVIRARNLDGCVVPAGRPFEFGLHIFDLRAPVLPYFTAAFERLAWEGLGAGRAPAELVRVDPLGPLPDGSGSVHLTLAAGPPISSLRVRFLSPTELKWEGCLVRQPDFCVLFARIRDRIGTLRELYGPGPLEVDFRGLGERANCVRLTRCRLDWERVERRSSKTGQTHPLGGFVGEAEYEGDLAEFLPYLRIAAWTGVGRQTVWGKGHIEVADAR